jgi:hypothetical protein
MGVQAAPRSSDDDAVCRRCRDAPARTATVGCRERVEPSGPPVTAEERREARRASIFLPRVRFWGLRQWRTRPFDPGSGPDGGAPIVKAGMSVRSPQSATVKVAPANRGWVALDYDRERWRGRARTVAHGDGQAAVRFIPCDPNTPRFSSPGRPVGGWTGWAGGLLVARPGCATLLVRSESEKDWRSVHVEFGADCPRGGASVGAG